ncbi:hypothetical protein [Natronorubrum sp. DTA7]
MPDGADLPTVRRAYDRLTTGYDREGETEPANASLERSATPSLRPDASLE